MKDNLKLKNHEIASYYNEHGILDELEDEEIEISLEEQLKEQILSGNRKHNLNYENPNVRRYIIEVA